jgi:hypothetical protein
MDCENLRTRLLVATLILFLQACVHSGSTSEILPADDDVGLDELVTVGHPPFATLSLESGGKLDFVDIGDDYVGIVERIPPEASSVLFPMVSKWTASPLEIYLAFAPAADDVPKALITDHKLQMARAGKANAPPRELRLQHSLPGTAAPPELEPFECDSFGSNWTTYWNDTFEGVTDFLGVAFLHQLQTMYTFYPGYNVFAGTGTNRQTYLGACNGDVQNHVGMEVHRWGPVVQFNPAPQPPTVKWQWLLVPGTQVSIELQERYLFYSGHPTGRYRARINPPEAGEVHEHFGVGAAWTKSFPIGIGF